MTMRNLILIMLFSTTTVYGEIVTKETINAWGYKENKRKIFRPQYCDPTVLNQNAEYLGIKSTFDSKELDNVKYRFTLGKETYPSVSDAKLRTSEINSSRSAKVYKSKICEIRRAAQVGYVVYFVHTDVGVFRYELRKILKKLVGKVSIIKQIN